MLAPDPALAGLVPAARTSGSAARASAQATPRTADAPAGTASGEPDTSGGTAFDVLMETSGDVAAAIVGNPSDAAAATAPGPRGRPARQAILPEALAADASPTALVPGVPSVPGTAPPVDASPAAPEPGTPIPTRGPGADPATVPAAGVAIAQPDLAAAQTHSQPQPQTQPAAAPPAGVPQPAVPAADAATAKPGAPSKDPKEKDAASTPAAEGPRHATASATDLPLPSDPRSPTSATPSASILAPASDAIAAAGLQPGAPDAVALAGLQPVAPYAQAVPPALTATAADAAPPVARGDAAVGQVAVAVGKGAGSGSRKVELRLDPPELGRVEIHLAPNDRGTLHATVIAERADTHDLLRRHGEALSRELTSAGYSDVTLSFSTGSDASAQGGRQMTEPHEAVFVLAAEPGPASMPQPVPRAMSAPDGGLDIRL